MNTAAVGERLESLVEAPGARLVLATTISEGLVVHVAGESAARAEPVAALFAAIYRSAEQVAAAHGRGRPRMLTVRAGENQVLATRAGELVLVMVAARGANIGRLRLELLRAAEVLT